MSQWAAEVKARGVAEVAAALGLTVRPNGRSLGPCPACHAPRRGTHDPRGPVGTTADGLGWICHRCQVKGDAVTLAAILCRETVPAKGDLAGWRSVAAFCDAHGLSTPDVLPGDKTSRSRSQAAAPPVVADPSATWPLVGPPRRPPAAEVLALWTRCPGVTDDAGVRAWLTGRRLNLASVEDRDLARALPLELAPGGSSSLPAWCQYRRATWTASTHRVIVGLYGPGGQLESLHARAVSPATPKDKAASPLGAEIRGLVMADPAGRRLLEGAPPPGLARVIVAEGVPDFLTWSAHYGDAAEDAPAVFGVIAGAWTLAIAATIPQGWTVIIRTHADAAGDKYAETIRATLAGRCLCKRIRSLVSA